MSGDTRIFGFQLNSVNLFNGLLGLFLFCILTIKIQYNLSASENLDGRSLEEFPVAPPQFNGPIPEPQLAPPRRKLNPEKPIEVVQPKLKPKPQPPPVAEVALPLPPQPVPKMELELIEVVPNEDKSLFGNDPGSHLRIECFDIDTDYFGFETGRALVHDIMTMELCQLECQKELTCKFFVYGTKSTPCQDCCYLKSSNSKRKIAPGFIAGPKYCDKKLQKALPCYNYDLDYEGFDVHLQEMTMTKTVEECQQLCQGMDGCQYFSYGGPGSAGVEGQCYFKKSDVNARHFKGMISGPRWCDGQGPSVMPTKKPTFGPTAPHAKFGTIKPQLIDSNCHIVKKICFFEQQTYVFGDDIGVLTGKSMMFELGSTQGGRIQVNTGGKMFNYRGFYDEEEWKTMSSKYMVDQTPMFIISDFAEMFYEMWARAVLHIYKWQQSGWMDANFPFVVMYPPGPGLPKMWKTMLNPFTNYNVYSWETFFRKTYFNPGGCFREAVFCRIKELSRPPPTGFMGQMARAIVAYHKKDDIDLRSEEKLLVAMVERASRRRILNRRDVLYRCETELNLDCRTFMIESMTDEFFHTIRKVDVFVFMHGSAGINGLFLPNGSTVVEILPFAAARFSNNMFRDWVYAGTGIPVERMFVKDRYDSAETAVRRWQMADSYLEWDYTGGAFTRAAHKAMIGRGLLKRELIGEDWRGLWSDDVLDHCQELGQVWGKRGKLFTDVKDTGLEYKKGPPKSKYCAENWVPIIVEVEDIDNLWEVFHEVAMLLHVLLEEQVITTRFGIILLTEEFKMRNWIKEVLNMFVRLEVMTHKEFIKGTYLPFRCAQSALLCSAAEIDPDVEMKREVLNYLHKQLLNHALYWEDLRKEQTVVHYATSDSLPRLIANRIQLKKDCHDEVANPLERLCLFENYDNFDRQKFWRYPWVNVFVFPHGPMGLNTLMFKNGTSVIEIFHESFWPEIPENEFEELTEEHPLRYFKYVETNPVKEVNGEMLVEINVKKFNVVLNKAANWAKEYVRLRGEKGNGRDLSFNTLAEVQRIQDKIEAEDPKDYKVKVIYADPASAERAKNREDLTVRPKLARPLAEQLAKRKERERQNNKLVS